MQLTIADALKKSQEMSVRAITGANAKKTSKAFMEVVNDSTQNLYDRGVSAQLLTNFQTICDSDLGQALTHSSDFGPYIMEVWPLITAWYDEFPLKDLISIQSMDKPLAYMFFSRLLAGTSKGNTVAGDEVETPLGRRAIKGQYPTGEVFGEEIPADQISGNKSILAYAPLNVSVTAGYLEKTTVEIGGTVYKAAAAGDFITFVDAVGTAIADTDLKIEVATGIIEGALVAGDLKVNYVWDLDFATTDNIQKVKEHIDMVPIEATPRAIMLEWTIFSEYLKKSQFNKDIREDNTKRILNLIYQFQVRYILDELYTYANGQLNNEYFATPAAADIEIKTASSYSLEVINQQVQKQFKGVASKIELISGRMEGNRVVCGVDLKNWLESLPSNFFKVASQNEKAWLGPRYIGDYGTFKVYYDPDMALNEYEMLYRGNEWYDAVYYLGEFMPVVPTDAIALGVTVRSSFCSMEAYKYHKPGCVVKGKVTFS